MSPEEGSTLKRRAPSGRGRPAQPSPGVFEDTFHHDTAPSYPPCRTQTGEDKEERQAFQVVFEPEMLF